MSQPARRLRIAVVSDAIYPYNRGGKEMRLHHLTTNLARMGHEVHVYTMQWWDGAPDRVEGGVHLHAISRHYPLYSGSRRSIRQAVMFFLACFKLVREEFDLLEVDHMPFFPLYAGKVVSVLKRRPMYATWHEVWGRAYWQEYLGVPGLIGYALERMSVYLPDHITAVSAHTAQRLTDLLRYGGPLSVAPNGIDAAAIREIEPAPETSDLIYVGRLLSHKNVDLLVRAVAQLKRQRPKLRCLIVGGGPEAERLRGLLSELGLQDNVVMKGVIKDDREVMALVKASRVFVLPSVREGFGVVALEAGVCGLPVVTIDHPDNAARHLVGPENGALCEPTAAGVAAAIEQVLVKQLRNDPEKLANDYNWQRIARRVAEVYAS
jgi:glycosyltransferase involved in cell wall biosynthesis